MLTDAALMVGGLAILMLGADILVRGAVAVARRLGISPLVVGFTVVAFGTSLPELTVSLNAALTESTALAVGNVVGSNIANILLILGVAAVARPLCCGRWALWRDGTLMLTATVLFIAASHVGRLGLWHGVTGLLLLAGALYFCYRTDKHLGESVHAQEADEIEGFGNRPIGAALALLGGLVGVIVGADLLVDGAVGLARTFGVPEEVIGLTLVAFGTSMPELATAIAAALRQHGDVVLGNVLGSNLFNLLGILGVVALFVPVQVPAQMLRVDLWILLGVSLLVFPFLQSGRRLKRLEGLLLLVLYGAFVVAAFNGIPAA